MFEQPLEQWWNVAGTSYRNVAGTRILGLVDTILLCLFTGGDIKGGCTAASYGCTTPAPYPRSHALAATHELCAGFDNPTSTPKSTPQTTRSARLGRSSSTGTSGRRNTSAARQPNTNNETNKDKENKSKMKGNCPPVARGASRTRMRVSTSPGIPVCLGTSEWHG